MNELWPEPGTPRFIAATRPHNTARPQRPRLVAAPTSIGGIVEVIERARAEGLVVYPQTSGHGAGPAVDGDTVLLDLSDLDGIEIDTASRVARVGPSAR